MAGRRGDVITNPRSVRPYIMAFEINSNEDGIEEDGDMLQEGQQIIAKTVGKPASQRELDEHMITHIPYRSWCKHCISGRGSK